MTAGRGDAADPQASAQLLVDLLDSSSRHHDAAFAELYDLTSRRVYGVVLMVLRSPDLAAEVTQEVYLEVWRQSGRFSAERGAVMPWMITIAHRRAVDRVRSVASQNRRDSDWCRLDTTTPYDQVVEEAEHRSEAQWVRAGLAALSDVQREAVVMAYFGGCTQREVAERLRVPLGTVKSRLRDALGVLRLTLS